MLTSPDKREAAKQKNWRSICLYCSQAHWCTFVYWGRGVKLESGPVGRGKYFVMLSTYGLIKFTAALGGQALPLAWKAGQISVAKASSHTHRAIRKWYILPHSPIHPPLFTLIGNFNPFQRSKAPIIKTQLLSNREEGTGRLEYNLLGLKTRYLKTNQWTKHTSNFSTCTFI